MRKFFGLVSGWLMLCSVLVLLACGGGGGGSSATTWPATGKTKVDANGRALAADAVSWSCVRDNNSGLMWEVKNTTDANHLRYVGKFYTNHANYDDSSADLIDAASNSVGFVRAVNAQGLCGATDWRMPTKDELIGLLTDRTDIGLYGGVYIDLGYFADVGAFPGVGRFTGSFWSSSPSSADSSWGIDFGNNIIFTSKLSLPQSIRLVRNSF